MAGVTKTNLTGLDMALQFEIDDLNGLDDSVKSLYVEHDGKYRLDVSGIDPADELKEALRKEREDNKASKQRAKELEEAKRLADENLAKKNGEYKTLFENESKRATDAESAYLELKKKNELKERESSALAIAGQLTSNAKRANVLKKEILPYVKYEDESIKYEFNGAETTPEKLVEAIKAEYDFLIDGPQSSGGGAVGGKSSGATPSNDKLFGASRIRAARGG